MVRQIILNSPGNIHVHIYICCGCHEDDVHTVVENRRKLGPPVATENKDGLLGELHAVLGNEDTIVGVCMVSSKAG